MAREFLSFLTGYFGILFLNPILRPLRQIIIRSTLFFLFPKISDRPSCLLPARWIIIQLNLAGPLMHVGGSIALEVRHVYGLRVVNVLFFLPLTIDGDV